MPPARLRPPALRTPPALSRSGAHETRSSASAPRFACDHRGRHFARRRNARSTTASRGRSPSPSEPRGRQPELECHRMVGDVLAAIVVALRGRSHGFAQCPPRLVAHVVLDGLVEAAGDRQADRLVGIASVVDGERPQHFGRPRSGPPPSAARASGASSSAMPRLCGRAAASREARTAASTVAPTEAARAAELVARGRSRCAAFLVGGVVESWLE